MGRRLSTAALLPALLLGAVMGGCKDSPAVSSVRHELEQQIPGARFEKEFHMRLGGFRLGLGRKLAGWALEEDEEHLTKALKSIKRVDVGTYRVVSLPPLEEIEAPPSLMDRLTESGWGLVAKIAEEDERIWLFMRTDDEGTIRNVYIVVLDDIELTMVSIEGRLDELLAQAIEDDPLGFAWGMAS